MYGTSVGRGLGFQIRPHQNELLNTTWTNRLGNSGPAKYGLVQATAGARSVASLNGPLLGWDRGGWLFSGRIWVKGSVDFPPNVSSSGKSTEPHLEHT